MDITEIRRMRRKQFVVTNLLFLIFLAIYLMVDYFIDITFAILQLIFGIIFFVKLIVMLVKGNSTKAFLPIFEQVAIYEKEKMGKEWKKQRKNEVILNFLLGSFFLLQYFLDRESNDVLEVDLLLFSIIMLFVLVSLNIGMFFQFRKVDLASSEYDLEGYTTRMTVVTILAGFSIGIIMLIFLIDYALLKIN